MIGFTGLFVDQPEQLGEAWEEALAAKRPVLLDVKNDPDVPPLPPHVTLAQARAFARTLMERNPAQASVIASTARQVLASMLPAKS